MVTILPLIDIDPAMVHLVGGKAAGLAELIRIGERVPDGFCVTTTAHRSGTVPAAEVAAAYRELPARTSSRARSSSRPAPIPGGRRFS